MRCVLFPVPEGIGILTTEFGFLLFGKVLLPGRMEVTFHLPHDVLGLVVVLHLKVSRYFCYFICMPADRAELPFLEPVHVCEGLATPGAPDN